MSCWLQTKTWPEVQEAIKKAKGVAIIPVGSVEQPSDCWHGYLCSNYAGGVRRRRNRRSSDAASVVWLESPPYGTSRYHYDPAGAAD